MIGSVQFLELVADYLNINEYYFLRKIIFVKKVFNIRSIIVRIQSIWYIKTIHDYGLASFYFCCSGDKIMSTIWYYTRWSLCVSLVLRIIIRLQRTEWVGLSINWPQPCFKKFQNACACVWFLLLVRFHWSSGNELHSTNWFFWNIYNNRDQEISWVMDCSNLVWQLRSFDSLLKLWYICLTI